MLVHSLGTNKEPVPFRQNPESVLLTEPRLALTLTLTQSHYPPRLTTFDIIHPPRNRHVLRHEVRLLQIIDVIHHRLVKIGKRQEIGDLFAQFGDSFLSASITQSAHVSFHGARSATRGKTNPRLFFTTSTASLCSNVSIPHPVCLTSTISFVASSCWLMTMERSASAAEPPAYFRIMPVNITTLFHGIQGIGRHSHCE